MARSNPKPKRVNVTNALANAAYHLRYLRRFAQDEKLTWYVARANAALDELNAARVQYTRDRRALDAASDAVRPLKRIERKVNRIEKTTRVLVSRAPRAKRHVKTDNARGKP